MPRASPPHDITPEEFFLVWVPTAVAEDPERRVRLERTEAVLAFELEGEGGGAYTLIVDRGTVRGSAGHREEHDLHVRLACDTWRALNAGSLSAPEAFLTRKVQLQGNFVLALTLHSIIG